MLQLINFRKSTLDGITCTMQMIRNFCLTCTCTTKQDTIYMYIYMYILHMYMYICCVAKGKYKDTLSNTAIIVYAQHYITFR